MKEMRKKTPDEMFHPVHHFKKNMDNLFKNFFGDIDSSQFFKSDFNPKIDLTEDEKFVYVKAEIPGAKKEDIEITVKENYLTIKGEKKEEKEDGDPKKTLIKESICGAFERTFSLPFEIDGDKAKASFKDGVLKVEIPKIKTKENNKKISID